MKKFGAFLVIALLASVPAFAQMDNRLYTVNCVGTTAASNTYVLRGELYGVYVDVPSGSPTGTVTVSSNYGNLFSLAGITADGLYSPRVATHNTAGAAQVEYTVNTGVSTTAITNAVLTQAAMAGDVTVKVTQTNPQTNDWNVTLIYRNR